MRGWRELPCLDGLRSKEFKCSLDACPAHDYFIIGLTAASLFFVDVFDLGTLSLFRHNNRTKQTKHLVQRPPLDTLGSGFPQNRLRGAQLAPAPFDFDHGPSNHLAPLLCCQMTCFARTIRRRLTCSNLQTGSRVMILTDSTAIHYYSSTLLFP